MWYLLKAQVFIKRVFMGRGLWLPLFSVIFIVSTWSSALSDDRFPIPKSLEKNVDFWTKIYGQYSSNHVIIHDKDDLSIIYHVVNLNNYYADSIDLGQKWKAVEDTKDHYRDILRKLAAMPQPIAVDSLSNEEFHVYILWASVDEEDKFSKAVYNIRGQLGLRDRFAESVKRSGFYFQEIQQIFQSHGLPVELCYLPHVESLFHYNIYSKVGAAGLWQFMYRTGRLYMMINSAVDERLDPLYATEAAAKFLKGNYDELESWPLAITAYNHGVNGMKAARQQLGTTDFDIIVREYKSRSFGFASKNFYAEFLAAAHVAKNYATYFGPLEIYKAKKYQLVELPESFYLRQLVEKFDVHQDTLISYNPALRQSAQQNWSQIPQGYRLRLPFREGYDPREVFVQDTLPTQYRRYRPVAKEPELITMAAATADTTKADDAESVPAPTSQETKTSPQNAVFESPPASLQSN